MFGLRSARGRVILAGVVLVVLLAAMAALAFWRTEDHHQLHNELKGTSLTATALEHARAQLLREEAALSTLIFSDDPGLVHVYQEAVAALEQDLSQARAGALAQGDADEVLALDDLTERIGAFNEEIARTLPLILEVDPETRARLASAGVAEMSPEVDAFTAELDRLAENQRNELAAARAAADRDQDTTLWFLIGFSAAAFLVAAGTVAMLVLSVVRPLASLRASARAITAGDLEARAKVSSPEEVASLGRDFNAMTDALSAKTKALQESERRYRLLAENQSDIIWTMDLGLRYTYMSPSVIHMRGYSVEEIVGSTVAETMTPASLEVARKTLAEELAMERMEQKDLHRSRKLELEMYCKDGSTVWTEVQVTFLRDPDGRPVGILGVTRDISERKEAEDALRESEERYRNLFDSTHDMIQSVAPDGRLLFVNRVWLKTLGYTEAELPRLSLLDIIHPESLSHCQELFSRVMAGESVDHVEATFVAKDGRPIAVEGHASGRRVGGRLVATHGFFRDVTERKRADEALRESEGRYRLIAENATDVIWTMDLNLRYTYMSPSVTRMRGYTVEEIVGTTVAETMTPASREVAIKAWAEELAIEKESQQKGPSRSGKLDPLRSRKLELEMYCKDGSTIWTEMNMTFLRDPDGRPVGILGVTRDITERKRAEDERKRLHAELEVRAITDGLTGLYNHAHFYQRLAEEIERSKRHNHGFAVVMMDVDAFKHYNDSRGHQGGDQALCLVGHCIRAAMRRSDIPFRYGGDEFAAILPHADSSKAQAIVNRINRRIGARLKENDDPAATWLGLSAGVACFPDYATTADDLVRMADTAMYDAKRLAWARGVMRQGQAIESPAPSPEALHETQLGMLSSAASSLAAALQDLTAREVIADLDLRTIAAVGAAAEIKDPYIRGHQERVSRWAAALAEEMELSPERVRDIRIAGLLHDLGKVGIGDRILNKPGKLTEEEFAKIKEHSALGAAILTSEVEALQQLVPIVRHHHERLDGRGYPDGLAGEDIPLEARIMSVVDVFDAMTHERSYRKALTRAKATAELERGAGTQFDPAVVKAFLTLLKRPGDEFAAPAPAANKGRPLATAKAAGRRKG